MVTPSQATILLELAQSALVFQDVDGDTCYGTIEVDDRHETWALRSRGFKHWLAMQFFVSEGKVPGRQGLHDAIAMLEARARYQGIIEPVYVRVAPGPGGTIIVDLADEDWQAVHITPDGWKMTSSSPAKFRRARGMQALPRPTRGGALIKLKDFVNVQDDDDWMLVVGWLLATFRPKGPYPVLVLSGEQGSAKTVLSKLLKALIDPNTAPVRSLSREERELMIAANNGYLLAFDNLSGLPNWLSDALCRLAAGGSFAVRRLYTDDEEVLFQAARPVLLNGIEEMISRPDLGDRAIFLSLTPIADSQRRPEGELWRQFELVRPHILGALLDAVAQGLRALGQVRLEALPRMADFALWATACEMALWPAGIFARAYAANRRTAIESIMEADPIATCLRSIMADRTTWTGSASDLLRLCAESARESPPGGIAWAKNLQTLAGRLRRAQTFLRTVGIEITFSREGRTGTRIIRSTAAEETVTTVSSVSIVSAARSHGCPADQAAFAGMRE